VPIVSVDGLSISGVAWTFKLVSSNLTHTDQHMACYVICQYILETGK